MPRIVTFNNRQIIEPGTYAKIESGIPVPPILGTYGNVMLIDTGSGKGFGYGSGIKGELLNGAQSIYAFQSATDAKKALGGGLLWDLMDYLWSPDNAGNGPQTLFYARAATTTASKLAMTFSSGAITFAATTEGDVANGVLTGTVLTKGFGCILKAGVIDPTKFIMVFYQGAYRGQDANGAEYDAAADTLTNVVITQSVEFSNVNQLIAWCNNDYLFNSYFKITASTPSATSLTATDLTDFGDMNLFAGGTTVYNATDIDEVLANIEDLDNSLFLCDDYGVTPVAPPGTTGGNKGALSAQNSKILAYIHNTSTFTEKIAFIGAGQNANEFTRPATSDGSLQIAAYYNDPLIVAVHSGIKVPSGMYGSNGLNYKYLPSLYHAAMWCGRTAGLEPQVPLTYKTLRISGLQHELKKSQREQALLAGVGHTRFVQNIGWVVNQGINTSQQNSNVINPNGTSPEIQIMRIIHQINKELIINATPRFVGGNLNTSSAEDVKAFTEGYLTSRTATRLQDNLILSFQNITVQLVNDYWNVRYCFVANGPINRLFFTGVLLDPNISI